MYEIPKGLTKMLLILKNSIIIIKVRLFFHPEKQKFLSLAKAGVVTGKTNA